MAKKTASKAPSGFAFSRGGTTVAFSWALGETYKEQEGKYYINGVEHKLSLKKGTKSCSFAVPLGIGELTSVGILVRGKASGDKWSAWGGGTWYIYAPPAPSLSVEYGGSSAPNKSTFTWSGPDDYAQYPFTDIEYQTALVPNANWDTPSNTAWNPSVSVPVYGSQPYIENIDTSVPDYSWTRFVRVRSRGAGGYSAYAYGKHVYALPYSSSNVSATLERSNDGNGYILRGQWNSVSNFARPIDTIVVSYAIAIPNTTTTEEIDENGEHYIKTIMSCPPNASWQSKNFMDVADTEANRESAVLLINQKLEKDQVVFFRVDTVHDVDTVYGTPIPVMCTGDLHYGFLDKPTGVSVLANPSNNTVQINATNSSSINDSFIAVHYRTESHQDSSKIIGILPHGRNSDVFPAPADDWLTDQPSFGLQTFVSDYSPAEPRSSGVTEYTIKNPLLAQKSVNWGEGVVPLPPIITATPYKYEGIDVTWTWNWSQANKAEISWADTEYAWESTAQPQTYLVSNLYTSQWRIAGLGVGTWYVRVRLAKETEDGISYGMYSETWTVKLASSPATPSLLIPAAYVTEGDTLSCYWSYATEDGTMQTQAEVAEVTKNDLTGDYEYNTDTSFFEETSQHLDIDVSKSLIRDRGWNMGETHMLAVRVTSASGETGNWSSPVSVTLAEPPTAEILLENEPSDDPVTSLVLTNITVGETVLPTYVLPDMPFIVTCIGAGNDGTTTFIIERREAFHLNRPDEKDMLYGFSGETLAVVSNPGEGTINITNDMLMGSGFLDDGAKYTLAAIVKDSNGLIAKDSVDFEVHWSHRAFIPSANVEIDPEYNIAKITPIAGSGYVNGDVCDIYRLSADRPELVISGAEFGTAYVDPYPTLGRFGGHRLVTRTANGDYRTTMVVDNEPSEVMAWLDLDEDDGDRLDTFGIIIDFNGDSVMLPYNVSVSNSWKKDFQKTSYLGGSVQGDWNPATERTSRLNAVSVVFDTPDDISAMRRLADYAGICHVRTPEGSSYAANVDVSEDYEERMINQLAKFSISITAVDSYSEDGMTYEDWIRSQEE